MPEIKRPIKLTLTAELDDGRIAEIAMPLFYLPDGMSLLGRESRESPGSRDNSPETALAEMEPVRG